MNKDALTILLNQLYMLNCIVDRVGAGSQYTAGYVHCMENLIAFFGFPCRLERIGALYHLFSTSTGALIQ